MMDYISIAEAAEKWGISRRRVQILCANGRIPGLRRLGSSWAVPKDAEKPLDARVKTGRFIGLYEKQRNQKAEAHSPEEIPSVFDRETIESVLNEYGIDYKDGISRCMNDEGFYMQLLRMFLEDEAYERTKAAFEAENYGEMFRFAHELKGICGNAAMKELYKAVGPLSDALHAGEAGREEIAAMMKKVDKAYKRARKGVLMVTQNA